jgi:hypothetical protein
MDLIHGNSLCTCRPGTNQVIFGGVEGRLYLANKLVTECLKTQLQYTYKITYVRRLLTS